MAGYNMYAVFGVHDWSGRAMGGTALRCLIHSVLCHRMPGSCSRLILEDKHWANQTEGLRTGHCVYKDHEGNYHRLIVPSVSNEDAAAVAQYLNASQGDAGVPTDE